MKPGTSRNIAPGQRAPLGGPAPHPRAGRTASRASRSKTTAPSAAARAKPGRKTLLAPSALGAGVRHTGAPQFATGSSRQFSRRMVPALPKVPGGACSSPLSLPAIRRGTPFTVKKRRSVTTPVRAVL